MVYLYRKYKCLLVQVVEVQLRDVELVDVKVPVEE
jgi:hypothetical protein